MQDVGGISDRGRSGARARARRLRAADRSEQARGERILSRDAVVHVRRLLEEARQHLLELVERKGRVGAVLLHRALDADARADPDRALGVVRPDEEDVALGRLGRE